MDDADSREQEINSYIPAATKLSAFKRITTRSNPRGRSAAKITAHSTRDGGCGNASDRAPLEIGLSLSPIITRPSRLPVLAVIAWRGRKKGGRAG